MNKNQKQVELLQKEYEDNVILFFNYVVSNYYQYLNFRF